MRWVIKAFVFFLLFLIVPFLQADESTDFKGLVKELNLHMINLEKRVASLEAQIKSNENIPLNKLSWRKLARGQSQDEVKQLLGQPVSIKGGYLTYWYYDENEYGQGASVTFDSDGRVYAWNEPG